MTASRPKMGINPIRSISGKKAGYARSKNKCEDLEFDIRLGNVAGLTTCTNSKVEE